MNEVIADCREKLTALAALEKCAGFTEILIPHLQALAKYHTDACRDRSKTPEKRAEHIEAAHELEKLADFLPNERKRLEGKIREQKKQEFR